VGQVVRQDFHESSAQGRTNQAAQLLQGLAGREQLAAPYRVALAWAGVPSPDGRGIAHSRFGPTIDDLVSSLQSLLPIANQPRIHSDARAALEGCAGPLADSGRHYALISGTGLGEAYFCQGRTWEREELLHFGRAAEFVFRGRDVESWLRAQSWRDQSERFAYLEVLGRLLVKRREQFDFSTLWLGGHFQQWFEPGSLEVTEYLGSFFPELKVLPMPSDCALWGVARLEAGRELS
jgi:hypothetical protein